MGSVIARIEYQKKIDRVLEQYFPTEREIAIYPYGYIARITQDILKSKYSKYPKYIFDNGQISNDKDNVIRLDNERVRDDLKRDKPLLVLCSDNEEIYAEVRNTALDYFGLEDIVDVLSPSMYFDKSMFFESSYFNRDNESFPRSLMMESCAREIYENNVPGSIAECGVYQGGFARLIKRMFPERKMYLFDTFKGFDNRDITEDEYEASKVFMERNNFLRDVPTIKSIMNFIPYNKNVVVKAGYFPDTANSDKTILEDKYAFVDLDMDLYKPTYDGLDFFWERLSPGGYIMIDEIRCEELPSARKAVLDWCKKEKVFFSSVTYEYPGLIDAIACIGKPL